MQTFILKTYFIISIIILMSVLMLMISRKIITLTHYITFLILSSRDKFRESMSKTQFIMKTKITKRIMTKKR